MNWLEQWTIIEKKFYEIFAQTKTKFTLAQVDSFLGITRGKSRAWTKGQRPHADDLQIMAEKLELSPEWLLCGTGEPEARNSKTEQAVAPKPLQDQSDEIVQAVTQVVDGLRQVGMGELKIWLTVQDMVNTRIEALRQNEPRLHPQKTSIEYGARSEQKNTDIDHRKS